MSKIHSMWRRAAALGAAGVALAAGAAGAAPAAQADAFGQLSAWGGSQALGGSDTEATFANASLFGASPSGDDVYVSDQKSTTLLRLRKFASDGTVKAVATAPIVAGQSGYQGIAVDAQRQRLYLLRYQKGADTVASPALSAAISVRVFSTDDSTGTLQAPADVPSGELPVPSPTGSDPLDNPFGIAVDPGNGDIVIGAIDRSQHMVVQRIGADGVVGARYVDTTNAIFATFNTFGLYGPAVGPDGTTYVATGLNGSANNWFGMRLPRDLSSATPLPGLGAGGHLSTGDIGAVQTVATVGNTSRGTQLAVSTDGDTLYMAGRISAATATVAGNYTINSYSVSRHAAGVVYGGSTSATQCRIAQNGPAVAPLADGSLLVLDHPQAAALATFGNRVLRFGPGGTGCPAPTASFKVAAQPDVSVTVQKGSNVILDATESDLHGATPTALAWDLDGSGDFATVVDGPTPSLTLTHRFTNAGTFTVGLRMTVSGSSFGDPPTVYKTVVVEPGTPTAAFVPSTSTPEPGATVTLDAAGSIDPTGSEDGGPTNALEEYAWDFGDGTTETTTEPTITHAFANASTAALARTVTLTVTSVDDVDSAPVSRTITVKGQPVGPPPPDTTLPLPDLTVPIPRPKPLAAPSISLGTLAKVKKGMATLSVRCAGSAATAKPCAGAVTLSYKAKGKKKATKVASASYRVAAGASATVKLKVSARTLKALKKVKGKATLRVTVTGGRVVTKAVVVKAAGGR